MVNVQSVCRFVRKSYQAASASLLNLGHGVVVRGNGNAARGQQMRRFHASGMVPGGVAIRKRDYVTRCLSAQQSFDQGWAKKR